MLKGIHLTILFITINFISFSQCNVIKNGSFDSDKGENITAKEWSTIVSSPDINDHTGSLH